MSRSNYLIGCYLTAVFFYWVSQYIYIPTLPLYANLKTDNLTMVGIILSMYGLWQALIRIPLGIVADWWGWRKPLIVLGTLLAGGGAWIMGTADGVTGLIIGRTMSGLAAGTWVLFVVAFGSLFPPKEIIRATALVTLISSLGQMLGTAVNGHLNRLGGYPLAFFVASGAALVSILLILPVTERRRPKQRPSVEQFTSILFRRSVLVPSLISIVVQYGVWSSVFGFFPLLAQQLGASDVTQSLFISLNIALVMLGNMITATLVQRLGSHRLLYLSSGLMAIGLATAALASHLSMMVAALCGIGFSCGISYPLLMGMSIEQVEETERATAMGLHQAIYAIGMFGGPWMSGILAQSLGIRVTLGVNALACLSLGILGTSWLAGHTRAFAPKVQPGNS